MKKRLLSILLTITVSLTACNYGGSTSVENNDIKPSEVSTTLVDDMSTEVSTNEINTESTTQIQDVHDSTEVVKDTRVPVQRSMNDLAKAVGNTAGYSDNQYMASFLVDVDLDGKEEAFVFYYKEENTDEYEIWFVDGELNTTKLSEKYIFYDENEIEEVFSYQYGNDVMVICNWPDSGTSYAGDVYLFREGKLVSDENSPFYWYNRAYKNIKPNGDIEATCNYYGFMIDKGFDDPILIGHAYIPYYYYYKDGKVYEYEAEEIDIDSKEYVWDKKPFEEKNPSEVQYLLRSNNELNVNIAVVDEKEVSFSAYRYKIGEDGKTLTLIDELDGTIGLNFDDFSFVEKYIEEIK